MAGAGAKKRAEENKRRLSTLRIIIVVASISFLAARLLIFRHSTTWAHWLGWAVTLAVHGLAYWTIAAVASPTYDSATGELLDGGGDLSKGGLQSYYHDLLYINALVQVRGTCAQAGNAHYDTRLIVLVAAVSSLCVMCHAGKHCKFWHSIDCMSQHPVATEYTVFTSQQIRRHAKQRV